jgi:hypothetical protein
MHSVCLSNIGYRNTLLQRTPELNVQRQARHFLLSEASSHSVSRGRNQSTSLLAVHTRALSCYTFFWLIDPVAN